MHSIAIALAIIIAFSIIMITLTLTDAIIIFLEMLIVYFQNHAALIQLPLKQLMQPPKESRLIREPDPTFVKNLKQKMLNDPAAPGATPMAVLCKGVDNFNTKYKGVYKYKVLGDCTQCWQKINLLMNFLITHTLLRLWLKFTLDSLTRKY